MPIVKHQAIDSGSHGFGCPHPQRSKVRVWSPGRPRKRDEVRVLLVGLGQTSHQARAVPIHTRKASDPSIMTAFDEIGERRG